MLATHLTDLLGTAPEGTEEALAVVDGLDAALLHGLARVGPDRAGALSALAEVFAGSPMAGRVEAAAAKIAAGSVADEYLFALAGARSALLGAVHDALLSHLDTSLGRRRAELDPVTAQAGSSNTPLNACRCWLYELAITGWYGVTHDLVAASAPIIEPMLADPATRRLAVLLDGFASELRACCPIGATDQLPTRRWADLWSRAVLLAEAGGTWSAASQVEASVTGRLLPLGVDVHEHATATQMQVHAILEPSDGSGRRLVRVTVGCAKVDTIVGPAVWQLLSHYPILLSALVGNCCLEVTGHQLLASGDLLWREEGATVGESVDPFATARLTLADALAPAVCPLDRHPVRIAEPVLVEGYTVDRDPEGPSLAFHLGDAVLLADVHRLPTCGPLTPDLVAASSACVGLIRWDAGRWTIQPLAVQVSSKRKQATVHTGEWAMGPTGPKTGKARGKGGEAVAVLRERAGRLLRR